MTTDDLIATLKDKRGSVADAAAALRVSRQAVYHHINDNPAVATALDKIRSDLTRKRKPLDKALRDVRFAKEEIEKHATENGVTMRAAARALVLAKLMAVTHRSERDITTEIRSSTTLAQALEDLLPPIDNSRLDEERTTMSTSLTAEQLRWIRSQPDGTVAKLLAASADFPAVSDTMAEKTQTTFSVRAVDATRLREAAAQRKETTQTLIRQVIEVARRQAKSARGR